MAKVIILGKGLSGLVCAARILQKSPDCSLTLVGVGYGGSPEIAAMNAPFAEPYGDSAALQGKDMLAAGYGLNDVDLVRAMCDILPEGITFLQSLGVCFAQEGAYLKRRHASGSSCPRSLCDTGQLLGRQVVAKLKAHLEGKVTVVNGKAVRLCTQNNAVCGVTVLMGTKLVTFHAPQVVAAFGGVGNLFPNSTYPVDVDGSGLSMAYLAGIPLIDLEFVEFEPLVTLVPVKAAGEPCPTAMLGEGAYLRNVKGERFMLAHRPHGEAGAPKSLINAAIAEEIAKGHGTPHQGVYVDLRHIPQSVLQSYPWFYDKLLACGHDVATSLLEVAPAAHSHSGGLVIDAHSQTPCAGLYAVGEAAGGVHGACRMAGNAASQALASGLLAADHLVSQHRVCVETESAKTQPPEAVSLNPQVRDAVNQEVQAITGRVLGLHRNGPDLTSALEQLGQRFDEDDVQSDILASHRVLAAWLVCKAALERTESRGTHHRTDFLQTDTAYSLMFTKGRHPLDAAMQRVVRCTP